MQPLDTRRGRGNVLSVRPWRDKTIKKKLNEVASVSDAKLEFSAGAGGVVRGDQPTYP